MTRDESRDVWLMNYGLGQLATALERGEPRTIRVLPESDRTYSRIGYVRYVPIDQLESAERERDAAKAVLSTVTLRCDHAKRTRDEALARVRELEVECEDTRYKLTEPSSHVGNGFGDAKATIGGEARASQREDYPWPVSFVDERYAAESRALEAEQLCDHAHERLRVAIEQRDNALIDFGLEKAAHRVALQAEARERQRVLDLERRINSILLEVEEYRELCRAGALYQEPGLTEEQRFRVGILRENCLERAAKRTLVTEELIARSGDPEFAFPKKTRTNDG